MHARALICSSDKTFSIEEVELAGPAHDQVAIRTAFSGVSVGTEFALIRKKISWGPYPLCTGYMGTGVIESVGSEVKGFKVGDSVYYRANDSMVLTGGEQVSCASGGHCSHVVTRPGGTHGVALMPPGVSMETAAMFVLPAVGLNGVDMANPRLGDVVVVHGVGLIGLGVVAACANRGCTVVAVDIDPGQLEQASRLGADFLINGNGADVPEAVMAVARDGADVVFECTGIPACIDPAIVLCRKGGCFVWQGNYGSPPISMHFLLAHGRQLKMYFPCDDGGPACRRAVLKQMALGRLDWGSCLTHRIKSDQAPKLYGEILDGSIGGTLGAVIHWGS